MSHHEHPESRSRKPTKRRGKLRSIVSCVLNRPFMHLALPVWGTSNRSSCHCQCAKQHNVERTTLCSVPEPVRGREENKKLDGLQLDRTMVYLNEIFTYIYTVSYCTAQIKLVSNLCGHPTQDSSWLYFYVWERAIKHEWIQSMD